MTFSQAIEQKTRFLMEGAMGVRLQAEYGLDTSGPVAQAAFIYTPAKADALQALWQQYGAIAACHSLPFLALTPTRRSNRERVPLSGCPLSILEDNAQFLKSVVASLPAPHYVGGAMGCKGDAYRATDVLSPEEGYRFHSWAAERLARGGVDFLFASILPALPEAVGLGRAMAATGLPYILSFMLRPTGRLIDGTLLYDAIARLEEALSPRPLFYMANCLHPKLLMQVLTLPQNDRPLVHERFLGLQANTAALPPEELDQCDHVITSDPDDLADAMMAVNARHPLLLFGGCCGTDNRHMEAIAQRLASLNRPGA